MTMKIRVEKLQKELSRGNAAEQYAAIKELKAFVVANLSKEQEKLQVSVSGVQSLINELVAELPANSHN